MSKKQPDSVATPRTQQGTYAKRVWTSPAVEQLPRLTDLTLVTGDPIPGGESLFP